jgi:SH3-like domain-containing protein
MEKPGCPFNHFGPCLTDKCRFYLPVLDTGSNCAILASYTSAFCANVNTQMLASSLNFIRTMLGLPLEPLEEFHQYRQLRALAGELKRVSGSLFVDEAVTEQAHACLDKVNRMLDILSEDDEDTPQENS